MNRKWVFRKVAFCLLLCLMSKSHEAFQPLFVTTSGQPCFGFQADGPHRHATRCLPSPARHSTGCLCQVSLENRCFDRMMIIMVMMMVTTEMMMKEKIMRLSTIPYFSTLILTTSCYLDKVSYGLCWLFRRFHQGNESCSVVLTFFFLNCRFQVKRQDCAQASSKSGQNHTTNVGFIGC